MVACAALLLVPFLMKSRTRQDILGRAAFRVSSSAGISVRIDGDVRHSGIYRVPANSLAESAIIMAEPCRPFNPTINRKSAPVLRDGSAVTITFQPEGVPLVKYGVMTVSQRLVLGIPLEIETMTEADFDRLPGVGPSIARRIVTYRQNNGGILRIDDLKRVEGIGEKKYKVMNSFFQPFVNTE